MTSYIPEYVYGVIPDTYREYDGPRHGLIPWPAHMTPKCGLENNPRSSGVELTKRGEAYVAAALAEAGGVFFLTIDRGDRQSIATTIERLINMLDDMEDDPDLEEPGDDESSIGWPEARGPSQISNSFVYANDDRELDTSDDEPSLGAPNYTYPASQIRWANGGCDDREEVCEDEGAQCEDEGVIDGV